MNPLPHPRPHPCPHLHPISSRKHLCSNELVLKFEPITRRRYSDDMRADVNLVSDLPNHAADPSEDLGAMDFRAPPPGGAMDFF